MAERACAEFEEWKQKREGRGYDHETYHYQQIEELAMMGDLQNHLMLVKQVRMTTGGNELAPSDRLREVVRLTKWMVEDCNTIHLLESRWGEGKPGTPKIDAR